VTSPPGAPASVHKRKAFAYVTHRDAIGERLLVFSHPRAPAAGIQVPAGTVDAGESPEAAVLREAHEETGLAGLVLVRFLGERVRDMTDAGRDEVHHRFFFHLRCPGTPAARWQHWEEYPSETPGARHLFEFFWARLPDGVPPLAAGHDALLPDLLAHLTRQP
jgi:8-oxo-dGTP pyrophosphatase MutT (NUDIX family)